MNFVLDFFVDKDTHPFDIGEMRLLFATSARFYERLKSYKSPTWRTAREFVYDDGITGVHFTVRYNKPGETDLAAGKLTYSGLCLEMDLPKSSFFGYEGMRIVAKLMKELNLLAACSSHMPEVPEPPKRYNYDELVEIWMKANQDEVTEEYAKRENLLYADRNKLLYWWRYIAEFQNLTNQMEEKGIVVPEIKICSKTDSPEAFLVCEWLDIGKSVIPAVDYVFVERLTKRSRRRPTRAGRRISSKVAVPPKLEHGMAPFDNLVKVIKDFCEQVREPLPYMIYSLDHAAPKVKQGLQNMELEDHNLFEPITPDSVIDVLPKAQRADE